MDENANDYLAEQRAQEFESANQETIDIVEVIPDEKWTAEATGEPGWTVGITAHHVGYSYGPLLGALDQMLEGNPPPLTMELLNEINAKHAEEYANCTKEETVALLREEGKKAAARLRELKDSDLKRETRVPALGDSPITIDTYIQSLIVGHHRMHIGTLKDGAGISSLRL